MIKRFTLALFATVACVIGASALSETVDGTKFFYIVNNSSKRTVTITNGSASTTVAQDNSYSGSVVIPDTFTRSSNGYTYTVTQIGDYAFYKCTSLTSVDLSNCKSLTQIGDSAFFSNTKLTSASLNGCTALTTIGTHAFKGCTALTSVNFSNCTSLTKIDLQTFYGCTSLTSVDLSSCTSLTSIGVSAFYGCTSLTSASLPTSLTSIGNYAFYNCSVLASTITLPSTLMSLGTYAFYGCAKIPSVDLSACTALTSLYNYTFKGCTALASVKLPESVQTIGYQAFYNCTSLDSIALPEKLTTINYSAFYGCTSLKTIKCKATSVPAAGTTSGSSTFYNCTALSKVYVRPYLLADYQSFETTGKHEVWETLNDSVFYPYYDLDVTSAKMATLALPFTAIIPADVTLYTLDAVGYSADDESKIVAGGTDITSGYGNATDGLLPYDVPVLVKAEEGEYEFLGKYGGEDSSYHLTASTSLSTEGVLVGVYDDTAASDLDNESIYVLQNQDGNVAFYYIESDDLSEFTIGQFRAYMTLDDNDTSSDAQVRGITFDLGGNAGGTTGISGMTVDTNQTSMSTDAATYTLQGVRVDPSNLSRGIYIQGGKKFVVK